ncbi:MAG: hypothetical protein IKF01_00850 [Bacilli bacterium]|nr:hypothetical protein [Bacilli bacterium]
MRKSERDKRNYLIIGLCAVLVVMVVGFAAFSSQLQINGTSEISSNWDVHIKDNGVTYKNAVDATSTLAEKTSNLVATFACNLITPGKSTISYDVVVENKGTLNAKLDSINLTGGNSAIAVVTSPTNASLSTSPIVLAPNDETTITVTVSYNDINTQPTGSGLTTNITAQLNFSQTNDSPVPATPTRTIDQTFVPQYYEYHTDDDGFVQVGEPAITANWVQDSTELTGRNYFLGHDVENGNVTANYACFVINNTQYCMRGKDGTSGTNYFIQNKALLGTLRDAGTITCDFLTDSFASCSSGGLINMDANSDGWAGAIGVSDSIECYANEDGSSCVEFEFENDEVEEEE